jgi:hypothetical protein
MAKPKRDEYVVNVSFRLYGEEGRRWDEVHDRAMKVDKHANKTDVIRSLLSLPPDRDEKPQLLTDADRAYFTGADAAGEATFIRHYLSLSKVKRAAIREAVGMLRAVPDTATGQNGFVIRIEERKRKTGS